MIDYKLEQDAKCAVIGHGSWATAIVSLLVKNEKEVWWYVRNEEVLESLLTEGCNPKYLNDVHFDTNRIRPSNDINEVVSNAKIIIMASPSAFLKDFLESLTVSLENKFVVSAIKGIIPGDYKTVVEYLHDRYDLTYKQIGIISGPSHAEEVGSEKLSYLAVVCTDSDNSKVIGAKISTKYLRISYSQDLYGVEYAAILKNIYALAVGIATGLAYGDNFRAVLVAKCAKEMTDFLNGSYPAERNTLNPEYIGDLLVTCYSPYSRNRRLGLLVGRGITVKSALNEMTMIAEGYYAVDCIKHINFTHKVEMPIVDAVYDIFYNRAPARRKIKELANQL